MKKSLLQRLRNPVEQFIFPCRCVFCRRLMSPKTQTAVCSSCMEEIPFCVSLVRCRRCGKPMPEPGRYCKDCEGRRDISYTRMCAPYRYQDRVRSAILLFKQERYQSFARVFAAHMQALLHYDGIASEVDAVVSAPPRIERMRTKGYDQAAVLGKAVARELHRPYLRSVLRQKEVRKRQSGLSEEERIQNIKGNIFVARPKSIEGNRVLLVDDVCTTGATIEECAKELMAAGAIKVYAVTAATVTKE